MCGGGGGNVGQPTKDRLPFKSKPEVEAEPQAGRAPAASATGSRAPVAITELTGAGGVPRNKHTLGKATVLGG